MKALAEARAMSLKHSAAFQEHSANFPPEIVTKWSDMIAAWEADPNKPSSSSIALAFGRLHQPKHHMHHMPQASAPS